MRVVVTLPVEPEWRAIVDEVLRGESSSVVYLEDCEEDERLENIREADAVLAWNPHRELGDDEIRATAGAELLQLMSAGADHLEFDVIPDSVTVACNAGAYAEPVAEGVLALALALGRNLQVEHENMKAGEFNQRSVNETLWGATLGIVGFGGIGCAVREVFEPFDVEVMAINSSGETDARVDWCGTLDQLDELLGRSDVVVLSLPLKPTTEGLIGGQQLEAMKTDATLINVARGEIIEERALYEHLEAHPEFKAGLEAWWVEPFRHGEFRTQYPFLELPNVLGCPHNAAVVPGALETGIRRAAENLRDHFRWGDTTGIVDPAQYRGADE